MDKFKVGYVQCADCGRSFRPRRPEHRLCPDCYWARREFVHGDARLGAVYDSWPVALLRAIWDWLSDRRGV